MFFLRLVLLVTLYLLTSCGGQGTYSGPPPGTYQVSVTVSGLPRNNSAQLVLNNNNSTLTFTSNTTQTFPYQNSGTSYNVLVETQPSPVSCTVTAGSGSNAGTSTVNVNVACSNEYVYVSNYGSNTVTVLQVQPSGVLGLIGQYTTGSEPSSVVIHPSGKYAYVSNFGNASIFEYTINSGVMAQFSSIATGAQPYNLAVSPDGKYLYCANSLDGTISEYSIDSLGALAFMSGSPVSVGAGVESLAIDPSSSYLFATTGTRLYVFKIQADGTLSSLGSNANSISSPTQVAVSVDGKFVYVVNGQSVGSVAIFPFNAGVLGTPSTVSAGVYPKSIAFTPSGAFAYVSNYGLNGTGTTVLQYSVNTSTGALTPMSPNTVSTNQNASGPFALVVDASGYAVFVSDMTQSGTSGGSVTQFLIGNSGILPANGTTTYSTGISSPRSIAVH